MIRFVQTAGRAHQDRLRKDVMRATQLDHRNVARVYGIGTAEHHTFVVSELTRGVPIGRLMHYAGSIDATLEPDTWLSRCFEMIASGQRGRVGKVPPNVVMKLSTQVAFALAHAHGKSALHGSLTPETIVIADGGVVKVLDFGIAFHPESHARLQSNDDATRVTDYIAPEQLAGDTRAIGSWSDVFAWAVITFEMLTLTLPWQHGTTRTRTPTEGARHAPKELNPLVPLRLNGTVMRSLVVKPKQRVQNGAALALALNKDASRRGTSLQTRAPTPITSAFSIAKGGLIFFGGGLLAIALLILVLVLATR